jgi:hypothetical protein
MKLVYCLVFVDLGMIAIAFFDALPRDSAQP